MKTWITYPAAILLGFSAHMLLGGWAPYEVLLGLTVPFMRELGVFILFPVVFVLFTSSVASLRRYKDTAIVFSSTLLWALFSTLLLSFLGMAAAILLPQGSGALSGTASPNSVEGLFDLSRLSGYFISPNAFAQFTVTSTSLLPILVIGLVIGIALRPDRETIRPAYVTVNSFAEAMMRLARIFTIMGAALLLFLSAEWFGSMDIRKLLPGNTWFLLGVASMIIVSLFILLPLIFAVLSLFRGGNPFRVLLGVFPALLSAGISGNLLFSTTALLALSQQNNGVRKRVAGISIPLLTIIGRGGSSMIATFTVIQVIRLLGGSLPSIQTMILLTLFSALFSFVSSFSAGMEVMFILFMVLKGIDAGSAGAVAGSVMVLLPILHVSALVIDAAVIAFGSVFCSRIISPDDRVPLEEMM